MPRVLILHTGGTLMMRAPGENEPLEPDVYGRDLTSELPIMNRIAEIDTRILFNLDSADIQPPDWLAMAREVHTALSGKHYDGVVIVHGTDTMAYTASALAMLLGPLARPVVLTGSQRPLVEVRTDARENLVDAVLLATLQVPEVSIAFASLGLRGARATKRDAWAYDAFESPNCAPLVELGVGIELADHVRKAGTLMPFDDRIEPRVLAVRIFPGLDPELVKGAVRAGVKGLVLSTYGTGTLPHQAGSLIPAIEYAQKKDVPVLVVSQCPKGFVDMNLYEAGAAAERAGAIAGGDMSVEAAIAKLMVGLGRFGPGDALRKYLQTDVVGELTRSLESSSWRASQLPGG